jgi:signal transduction histidine kinase
MRHEIQGRPTGFLGAQQAYIYALSAFDRFQKGKSSGSGKGLGLYICRMIIEGCGGRIEAGDRVEKDPGKGAAIRFTLRKACTGEEGKNLYPGDHDTITHSG